MKNTAPPSRLTSFLKTWIRRLPGILLISLLLHLILIRFWAPHARSVMLLDKDALAAEQKEITQRENERKKAEQEVRAKRALPTEHKEKLREEAERRDKQQAEKKLRDILRNRESALKLREEMFERIENRKEDEFIPEQVSEPFLETAETRLKELAESVEGFKDAVPETEKTDIMRERDQRADELLEQVRELVENIRDNPVDPSEELTELTGVAEKIRYLARQEGHRGGESGEPAWELSHQGNQLNQEVEKALNKAVEAPLINDLSEAETIGDMSRPGPNADIADLYEAGREAEKQTEQAVRDTRAAELALRQHDSFGKAKTRITDWSPDRPDLAGDLRKNTTATVGDLNAYREQVKQATSTLSSMATRTASLTGQMAAMVGDPSSRTRGRNLPPGLSQGWGEGDSSGGRAILSEGDVGSEPGRALATEAKLPEAVISAKALPGRRFTESSSRQGWLFIDTWYHIGPWENHTKTNFAVPRPPEQVIDFDAEYPDGKFSHIEGHVDQVLRWQFLQSDQIRIQPLRVYGSSTYFFYTEVFFDRSREMIVTIAADDAAILWVNGEPVVDRSGLSPYKLGELLLPITFQQGTNTLLIRLENSPGPTLFSVLLCPREAVEDYL
ncbi:MAG: hypothetical protein WD708_07655 [Kiritimatiellia bacterium]